MIKPNSVLSYGLSLCMFCALVACGSKKDVATQGAPMAKPLPAVKIAKGESKSYLNFASEIINKEVVEIKSRTNGYVDQIFVEEGAKVSKGQVIMRIDPREYVQRVNSATATLNSVKAQAAAAALEVRKQTPLVEKGIISKLQLETTIASAASAKAQVLQAEAQLQDAKLQLSYTNITSPMNGVISRIDIYPGSLVSSGSTITTVSENSDAIAYFSFDEKKALELSESYKDLAMAVDSLPEAQLILSNGTTYPYSGKIELASSIINGNTGSVQLKAIFENPQLVLRSGATGKVRIPIIHEDVYLVPQKATFEVQDKKMVYVVGADSALVTNVIEIIGQDGDNYAVTKGIEEGTIIITEGLTNAREGMKVIPQL